MEQIVWIMALVSLMLRVIVCHSGDVAPGNQRKFLGLIEVLIARKRWAPSRQWADESKGLI